MASSGNFAVWNKLAGTLSNAAGSSTLYEHGNTSFRGNDGGGNNGFSPLTLHMTSGKWYFEVYLDGSPAGGWPGIGIIKADNITEAQRTGNFQNQNYTSHVIATNGNKNVFDQTSNASYGTSFSSGDIYNIAVDIDGGKVWWGKNNTYFNSGNPATGDNAGDTFTAGTEMAIFATVYNGASKCVINSGQNSTFNGAVTAGSNADGNGFGDFKYSPPSGYLALCSANLPVAASIDPAETDDNHPQKNFNALIYSGDGTSSNAITGLGFRPDLTWIKERNGTNLYSHSMTDSSRGRARMIFAEHNREEDGSTSTQDLVSFDSDGFTVGSNQETNSNGSTGTFISWCWRANAGTTATNTSGTITSTVQANQDLGFSIVTWTGTGTNSTVGHGLSAAPDCIWIKNRTDDTSSDGDASGRNWVIFNSALGSSDILSLNQTNNKDTGTGYLNGTDPTSTVFSVGESVDTNESSHAMIAYCWHNIVGYQKFGTYTGNGNADGPYVNLGFRPRLVITKMTNGSYSEHWNMWDSVDDTKGDPCGNDIEELHRITEATEATSSTIDINFFSNGFKITGSNTEQNEDNKTIAYFAWADVPFKYNNGF